MRLFCLIVPRLGPRLRVVIVVLIYLLVSRLAPGDAVPMTAGAILGLFAVGPAASRQAGVVLEGQL
jgi:hypothetical protein